jgi:hypothetical protein
VRRIAIFSSLAAAFIILSCASAPTRSSVDGLSISVRPASGEEISKYGGSFSNPYLPPKSLFFKSDLAFLVLIAQLDSAVGGESVVLEGIEDAGNALRFYPKQDFISWWYGQMGMDKQEKEKRLSIEASYFPAKAFNAKPGTTSYYLVLIGKAPIAKSQNLVIDYLINGEKRATVLTVE